MSQISHTHDAGSTEPNPRCGCHSLIRDKPDVASQKYSCPRLIRRGQLFMKVWFAIPAGIAL